MEDTVKKVHRIHFSTYAYSSGYNGVFADESVWVCREWLQRLVDVYNGEPITLELTGDMPDDSVDWIKIETNSLDGAGVDPTVRITFNELDSEVAVTNPEVPELIQEHFDGTVWVRKVEA